MSASSVGVENMLHIRRRDVPRDRSVKRDRVFKHIIHGLHDRRSTEMFVDCVLSLNTRSISRSPAPSQSLIAPVQRQTPPPVGSVVKHASTCLSGCFIHKRAIVTHIVLSPESVFPIAIAPPTTILVVFHRGRVHHSPFSRPPRVSRVFPSFPSSPSAPSFRRRRRAIPRAVSTASSDRGLKSFDLTKP